MTPYRHLLCPVDFSDVSRRALRWSSSFAREVDARLSVLHVIDTGALSIGNLVAVPNAREELRQRVEESVLGWKREGDLVHGEIEIVEGLPADVIAASANERDVDLLVMGTHGLSGFQKLLLGSVTEKVLHRVRVPMLTLSPSAPPGGEGFETVVMAIDFGPESQSVVRHGVWLAEHFGAKLVAAHAVPVPYVVLNERTVERLGPRELARLEESLTADRKKDLERLLPESTGSAIELVVRVGSPFELLAELSKKATAGLMVMGAGGHGDSGVRWLGSTCHKVVRSAPCPVWIVR
jgi:nucleotide-binding universal stress UspA family protein